MISAMPTRVVGTRFSDSTKHFRAALERTRYTTPPDSVPGHWIRSGGASFLAESGVGSSKPIRSLFNICIRNHPILSLPLHQNGENIFLRVANRKQRLHHVILICIGCNQT